MARDPQILTIQYNKFYPQANVFYLPTPQGIWRQGRPLPYCFTVSKIYHFDAFCGISTKFLKF